MSDDVGTYLEGRHRILVVEDEPQIRRVVVDVLDQAGFDVMQAGSGPEGLSLIDEKGLPHLAVVDLMMPGMHGFEFCRVVQEYSDLPVVMLTAIDEEETVIQGLERYAEDYITKPFRPRELIARVRRVLRRIGNFAYSLEGPTKVDQRLTLDFVHQQANVEGETVGLTPTETKLLYILMRSAGQTVTSDFLLRRLWPLEEVYEDSLRVHVHRLRRKIEVNPSKPKYVQTERGMGYRFARGQ